MQNPLPGLIDKHLGPTFVPRMKRLAFGLAQDFWKDGGENPLEKIPYLGPILGPAVYDDLDDVPLHGGAAGAKPGAPQKPAKPMWHAAPGEISERMWGEGFVTPAGAEITQMLIGPLGLTKEMNVLDLSAGLGGRMRKITKEFGAYITGLEPDPEIAARGMEMSIRAGKGKHAPIAYYDPAKFSVARTYDCIIARETFYRVADKAAFFAELSACSKPKAQIVFTDYILDPENRDKAGIKAWQGFEKNASPLGLVEMAEMWAKVGFSLRVNEDLTDMYKKEVTNGLKRLALSLGKGLPPDPPTKKAVLRRVETWVHRMAAMEQGMKFYRFYGTKAGP